MAHPGQTTKKFLGSRPTSQHCWRIQARSLRLLPLSCKDVTERRKESLVVLEEARQERSRPSGGNFFSHVSHETPDAADSGLSFLQPMFFGWPPLVI